MKKEPLNLRRLRRVEYERFVKLGMFEDQPLELLGGRLMVAEPQGPRHATAVGMAEDALRAVLPSGWLVRSQAPVALDSESEPEPDVAVVQGGRADYRDAHPTRLTIAIEVAEASLVLDRAHKGSLYARAQVPDYWIVNLLDGVVEVYRNPVPVEPAPYGWAYRSVERLAPPAAVAPLALPAARIAVAALLP